jgi:hypothetical protein
MIEEDSLMELWSVNYVSGVPRIRKTSEYVSPLQ